MKNIVYSIEIESFQNPDEILDEMIRYSGDEIIERDGHKAKIKHPLYHKGCERFFYSHVKPRWESFGCIVKVHSSEQSSKEAKE